MYPNLRAEMARWNVSTTDFSSVVGKTERSIRDKISGKGDFTLTEIIAIRDTFFPGQSIDYLFERLDAIRNSA